MIVIVDGKGVFVWDMEGKEYIEVMVGFWCIVFGYGVEELVEIVVE